MKTNNFLNEHKADLSLNTKALYQRTEIPYNNMVQKYCKILHLFQDDRQTVNESAGDMYAFITK